MTEKERLKELKDEIEAQSVDQPRGLGDIVDLKNMFRIKGVSGIFVYTTPMNRAGMITLTNFVSLVRKTTHKKTLINLRSYVFYTTAVDPAGEKIILTIEEVFNNLNNHFQDVKIDSSRHIEQLMEVMCPNYDPEQFKEYHAKRVLGWYDIIKTKVIQLEKMEKLRQKEADNA